MIRLLLVLTLLPDGARGSLPSLLARIEPLGRPLLLRYYTDQGAPAPRSLTWCTEEVSANLQGAFWRWANRVERGGESGSDHVIALPALAERELRDLVEMAPANLEIEVLPQSAPVGGLVLRRQSGSARAPAYRTDHATTSQRMRTWVARTLTPAGLKFCPYTGSALRAATGLEASGITAAPIAYAVADGSTLPELLEAFWDASIAMLEAGEEGTSSIILAAPWWDTRWDEWCRVVFPCLEASLLASRRSRELGIVCFHPLYEIPDVAWLARHRFGHMRSSPRLRSYVDEENPQLSESIGDDDLEWAAAYQRRSPHAMINVLWSRQLEIAETKRRSSSLYTRNINRALSAGREDLERAAVQERETGF